MTDETYDETTEGEEGGINVDFDLEDEYKEAPLCPTSQYFGNVIGTSIDNEASAIVFKIALDGNGGVMSDGETPIDGSHHYFRIWLPRKGDDKTLTKSGRQTKRQWKINNMKKCADKLGISMNTPQEIVTAVEEQDWIGLPVIASISIDTYEGDTRNVVDKMVRNTNED